MSKSAVSEAMNQMIGSSATSMSQMFKRKIEISPPVITAVYLQDEEIEFYEGFDDDIVVISFNLEIGEILKSRIMLLMNKQEAKREAGDLIASLYTTKEVVKKNSEDIEKVADVKEQEPEISPRHQDQPAIKIDIPVKGYNTPPEESKGNYRGHISLEENINSKNLDLILDVPLKLSVLLGRSKKSINDILKLGPGSIVELEKLADEPVDILVNDTLIAEGEVVPVNEYFGVRVTSILTPENRIISLVRK